MKPDHHPGKPPTVPVIDGTVLRNVPQVDWHGKHTFTRLDVQDETGDLHITVSVTHPLAKADKGDKLTIVRQ